MQRTRIATAALVLSSLLPAAGGVAQEGFPLDGTWRGEWGSPDAAGGATRVVVVMSWDGERIDGVINPGPRSIPFDRAELDASTWTVRIEAKNADAEPILVVGRLEDIGSYNRRIEGTWTEGGEEHPFEITRE